MSAVVERELWHQLWRRTAGTQMRTEMRVVQAYTAVLFRFWMSPMALHSALNVVNGKAEIHRVRRRFLAKARRDGSVSWEADKRPHMRPSPPVKHLV